MVKTQINENRNIHTLYNLQGKRNGGNNGQLEQNELSTCADKQLHVEREAEDLRGVPGPECRDAFHGPGCGEG